MANPLDKFRIAQFEFNLKAKEPLDLPAYKGSTLRGGFGSAFKKIVCVNRERVCESCLLKGKCVYLWRAE
jgi:hypothetical protein